MGNALRKWREILKLVTVVFFPVGVALMTAGLSIQSPQVPLLTIGIWMTVAGLLSGAIWTVLTTVERYGDSAGRAEATKVSGAHATTVNLPQSQGANTTLNAPHQQVSGGGQAISGSPGASQTQFVFMQNQPATDGPHVTLGVRGFFVKQVQWSFGITDVINIQLLNSPLGDDETAVARDVRINFTVLGTKAPLDWITARLDYSVQPPALREGQLPELAADIGIEEWKEWNLVIKEPARAECYLYSNDSFQYRRARNERWEIPPGDYRLVAKVNGVGVRERFECRFRNPGEGSHLLLLQEENSSMTWQQLLEEFRGLPIQEAQAQLTKEQDVDSWAPIHVYPYDRDVADTFKVLARAAGRKASIEDKIPLAEEPEHHWYRTVGRLVDATPTETADGPIVFMRWQSILSGSINFCLARLADGGE